MNSALLLISLSVIGVDYGWERTPDGEQEYIIQLEPEILEKLRQGEVVTSEVLPEVKGVRRFRIQVGTGVLPKGDMTIKVGDSVDLEATSTETSVANEVGESIDGPDDSINAGQDDASGASDDAFEVNDGAFELDVDATSQDATTDMDDAFELPNQSSTDSLLNPDEAIAAHYAPDSSDDVIGAYQGGTEIPEPEALEILLNRTVSAPTIFVGDASEDAFPGQLNDNVVLKQELPNAPGDFELNVDLEVLANVDETAVPEDETIFTEAVEESVPENRHSAESVASAAGDLAAANGKSESLIAEDAITVVKAESLPTVVKDADPISAASRPWGTLVMLCLLLFGSVGANIYMAYTLTGLLRKRNLITN